MFRELLQTIVHRPYVFAFLAAYLYLGWRFFGWRAAIVWLLSGFGIAWLSEFSSIHTGFPYGEYHYLYANMPGELMIGGVPLFDSLSYPFVIFAGYSTAAFILRRPLPTHIFIYQSTKTPISSFVVLGAILTMLLDVIIDPIATMGDKWFLGKIHFYAHPGWYFGVPFTNFLGWLLVAFVVIACNAAAWHFFPELFASKEDPRRAVEHQREQVSRLYPLFYAAIAIFNIAISFAVGAWPLGLVSSILLIVIMAFTPSARGSRGAR
jgi:uncharacterized membrane protein